VEARLVKHGKPGLDCGPAGRRSPVWCVGRANFLRRSEKAFRRNLCGKKENPCPAIFRTRSGTMGCREIMTHSSAGGDGWRVGFVEHP